MINKKGMEMSLSTVIVAVILLVVLGVVLFIFIKGMRTGDGAIGSYFEKVNPDSDTNKGKTTEQIGSGLFNNWILPIAPVGWLLRKKRLIYESKSRC